MRPRRRTVLVIAVTLLMTLVVVVSNFWRLRGSYHRHGMYSAWERFHSKPEVVGNLVGYSDEAAWEQFEYHRDQLVELGQFGHVKYTFRNISVRADEARHLLRLMLHKQCPDALYWQSPHPNAPEPLRIDLWCELRLIPEWEAFLKSRDIPSYRSEFMRPSPPEG